MKVAVVNSYSVKDIKIWSGIPFHISIMLESVFGESNMVYISIPTKRNLFSYLKGFYFNRIKHKNYLSWADKSVVEFNRKAFKTVRESNFDLIITFESFLIPLLFNEKSKIFLWTDATFHNLLNFYSYVSNLSSFTLNNGNELQEKALHMSDAIIFSSKWAINTAVQYYSTDPCKLNLIPFASNLNTFPGLEEINEIIKNRTQGILKLLFIGVDWERKGGDMAIRVLNNLNNSGIKSMLYVVGTEVPSIYNGNGNIVPLGFINKNMPEGEKQIIALFKECSFLILPSKADCTPVVFSEANSYGLPVITTDVGGISSVVVNNLNGYFCTLALFVREASSFIEGNWKVPTAYSQLCLNSYQYYMDVLSWEKTEEKFREVLLKNNFLL